MTDGPPRSYPPPGAPPPEDPADARPARPAPPPPPPPGSAPNRPGYAGGPASYPVYSAGPSGRPGQAGTPVGMLGAAHKPGAIPLRPLTLGSIYDGAFRIIRFNPKATVGSAVLVTAVAMLLPVVLSTIVSFTVGTGIDPSGGVDDRLGTGETLGLIGSLGSLVLGLYAAQLGIIFVTGMIAHVTHAAAVGRRLSLTEAWAATRGKRWRLLGQALLIGLVTVVALVAAVLLVVAVALATESVLATVLVALGGGVAFLGVSVWLWIRVVYLAAPALMLEPVGVFGAFGRNWRLTAGQFWRTLGIGLLTMLIGGVAGSILSTPISFLGQFATFAFPEHTLLLLVLTQAFGLIVQNAFVAPFLAAVTSLQYLDQRMRKEAYDVELMGEAGLIPR